MPPDKIRVYLLKMKRRRCHRLAAGQCSPSDLTDTCFGWSYNLPLILHVSMIEWSRKTNCSLGVLYSQRRSTRTYKQHSLLITSQRYLEVVEEDHNQLSVQSPPCRPIPISFFFYLLPFHSAYRLSNLLCLFHCHNDILSGGFSFSLFAGY